MSTTTVNLDALAQQSGAVGATTPQPTPQPNLDDLAKQSGAVNLDDLAKQSGAVGVTTPPPPPKSALELAGDNLNSIADILSNFSGPQANAKIASGAVKGGEKSAAGLLELIDKYLIAPNDAGATPATQKAHQYAKATSDWLRKNTDTQGWEKAGDFGETLWELAGMKGLLKAGSAVAEAPEVISDAERLAQMAKDGKTLESNPAIAHLVRLGRVAKAAAVSGAEQAGQTFVKTGGDPQAALTAGIIGVGTGGLIQGGLETAGAVADAVKPTTETLEGHDMPVLASQRPDAPAVAKLTRPAEDLPEFDKAQQAVPDKVIASGSQRAVKNVIDKVNETRQIQGPTDASGVQPGQFKFTVDRFDPRMEEEPLEGGNVAEQKRQLGSAASTIPERLTGGPVSDSQLRAQAPGSIGSTVPERVITGTPETAPEQYITTDPTEAQKLLTQAQRISENPMIGPRLKARVDARIQSLSDQLDQYHTAQATVPNFKPIDATEAMRNVQDYRTAGDLMQNSVKDVYKRMDAATDGEMSTLIQQPRYKSAARMEELFQENKNNFTRPEWDAATEAYRKGFVAKELDAAIQKNFNITKQTAADTADIGGTRRFTGSDRAANDLDNVIADHGDDVKDMIGNDGIRSLRRMNQLLKGKETSGPLSDLIDKTARVLRRHGGSVGSVLGGYAGPMLGLSHYSGAMAGVAAGEATTKVVNMMATSPVIADRIAYAIEHKIGSHIAAPLIASMIVRADGDNEPKQETK